MAALSADGLPRAGDQAIRRVPAVESLQLHGYHDDWAGPDDVGRSAKLDGVARRRRCWHLRYQVLAVAFNICGVAGACRLSDNTCHRAFCDGREISAPFIGYFIYRVNHPAIFTLCYAPLISLAWLKVIYAEDERSRLRWVAGLMLANWLVINSGTAKEAYMAIVVLNAIGILHFMVEKSRFGGKFKTWSGLLAASGVCFLMIAAPLWGTFLDTLRSGISNYDSPGVRQYPFWFFLGFVDNFFYLLRTDDYSPAVNALLFVGFLRGIFCTPHLESPEARRSAVVLALGCGMLIAIAFGVIPAKWLLAIPYINNIRSVDACFSTILIVPLSILAGIGFASIDLQRKKRVEPIVVSVLIALVLLFVLSFAQSGGLRLKQFALYIRWQCYRLRCARLG